MLLMIKNAVAGTTWHITVERANPTDRREPASVGTSKKLCLRGWLSCLFQSRGR